LHHWASLLPAAPPLGRRRPRPRARTGVRRSARRPTPRRSPSRPFRASRRAAPAPARSAAAWSRSRRLRYTSSPRPRRPWQGRRPRRRPGRQTPGAPARCRTGSPCSRRCGSRRSRPDAEAEQERPHPLGESGARAAQVLETDVHERATARERAAGAGREPDLGGRGRTGAEWQLPAARPDAERREAGVHLQTRRPAHRVERARLGDVVTAETNLPNTFGAGLRWAPSPSVRLAGTVGRRTWADAGAGAFNTVSWSAGLEVDAGFAPFRVGARGGQLPFGAGPTAPTEVGFAAGT